MTYLGFEAHLPSTTVGGSDETPTNDGKWKAVGLREDNSGYPHCDDSWSTFVSSTVVRASLAYSMIVPKTSKKDTVVIGGEDTYLT